jgi:hypothetical protein
VVTGAAEAIDDAMVVGRNKVSNSGSPGMTGSYLAGLTLGPRRAVAGAKV